MQRVFIVFLVVISTLTSCSKKSKEFNSIDELAHTVIELLNDGDAEAIDEIIMPRDQFAKEIHPETPEAKSITGEEMFDIFIKIKRANAIMVNARYYKGNIVELKSIGKAESVFKAKSYILYKKIPLTLTFIDNDLQTKEVINENLLGVVIEKNGKYMLMNMFDD